MLETEIVHRFYMQPLKGAGAGSRVTISADEAAHMRVLRLGAGDGIELIDGEGGRFAATVCGVDKAGAQADIDAVLSSNEPAVRVTLYQGMPKADKLELITQKTTELGVAAIRPVYFAHGDVKPADGRDAKRQERLERIAREAAKQCGRAAVPRVLPPQRLAALAGELRAHSAVIVPWEQGGRGFMQAAARLDISNAAIVIGPEGGIAPEEIELLLELGAVPVTLGRRILRTETAAIAAVAALMAAGGEWDE